MNALAKTTVSQADIKIEISHAEYIYYIRQARLERSKTFHQILAAAFSYFKKPIISKKIKPPYNH
ncbi:MAG: hypothetical protein OFPII_17320 [Osedax symbiont Rs1]|nr:MAG: hypothetical protein OFPII_17320 [Osedax symbiont Rs1]